MLLNGAFIVVTLLAVPAQQRLASAVVNTYGDERAEVRAVSGAVGLPANVAMPSAYDELVTAMLRSSPTFRGQCSRIARTPHLSVVVRRSISAPAQAAVTHVFRRPDGRLDAEVEVGLFGDVALLLAHEFEHIVEQLDGVDLAGMAARPGTGVRTDPRTGQFETDRAIAIGRRVAREVSRDATRR
jgi:hypothetical protein